MNGLVTVQSASRTLLRIFPTTFTGPLGTRNCGLASAATHPMLTANEHNLLMRIVNTNIVDEVSWTSPKGKFAGFGKEVSEALGRQPSSTDMNERHPFDVEITRVPPGKSTCPFHSHSAQWEFYHVISGRGLVRHKDGTTPINAGAAFIFRPGEPHQLINDNDQDLVLYVVADNPIGESCHYPDSGKWLVRSPERRVVRSDNIDYYDGEE